jgi:hypothetical protein
MFRNKRRLPAAACAGGLVALLVALIALAGCGKEPSMASKSAAAFREAQKRGETIGGSAHGHGALTPGGGHEMPGTTPESGSAAGHSGMAMEGMDHSGKAKGADHSGMAMGGTDHSKMDHSKMAHGGMDHSKAQGGMDHSKMEGMDHSGMAMGVDHSEPVSVAASSGQPAATLNPDALDAPAATSVADAQRSAAMAEEMKDMGGHGGHGSGTYRQIDAGRGPGAYEGSEKQTPGAEPHHHDPPPPPGQVHRRKG